jgi:hypothetical protein
VPSLHSPEKQHRSGHHCIHMNVSCILRHNGAGPLYVRKFRLLARKMLRHSRTYTGRWKFTVFAAVVCFDVSPSAHDVCLPPCFHTCRSRRSSARRAAAGVRIGSSSSTAERQLNSRASDLTGGIEQVTTRGQKNTRDSKSEAWLKIRPYAWCRFKGHLALFSFDCPSF